MRETWPRKEMSVEVMRLREEGWGRERAGDNKVIGAPHNTRGTEEEEKVTEKVKGDPKKNKRKNRKRKKKLEYASRIKIGGINNISNIR